MSSARARQKESRYRPSQVLADNAAYFHHASELLSNRLKEEVQNILDSDT
jgi:hypothetical protein